MDPTVEYDDHSHRYKKMTTLKGLMKSELSKAHEDGQLDLSSDDLRKSMSGYPSFMKEKSNKLKEKSLMRMDTKDIEVEPFAKQVKDLLISKVEEAEANSITEPSDASSTFS